MIYKFEQKMGGWHFYGFSLLDQGFDYSCPPRPAFLVKTCPHLFNVALTYLVVGILLIAYLHDVENYIVPSASILIAET